MKTIKTNKNGQVSKISIDDVLSLEIAGSINYFQGNIMKHSTVRGNDEFGYYASDPTVSYAPYFRVIKIGINFVFDER